MNKKKIIIISLAILVLLLLIIFLVFADKENKIDYNNTEENSSANETSTVSGQPMTEEEKRELSLYHLGTFEVLARDDTGKITSYVITGAQEPKKIDLEWMTEEEKATFNIAPETKIQVLARDQNGKVIAYRVIKQDSDIVEEY